MLVSFTAIEIKFALTGRFFTLVWAGGSALVGIGVGSTAVTMPASSTFPSSPTAILLIGLRHVDCAVSLNEVGWK